MQRNKILIVDDEQEVCMLLSHFFKAREQDTDYATSLQEGLQKFSAQQPDILILDHNLPDGYGIDNIPRFTGIKENIRIVVISAMSNLRDKAISNGATLFLEKPISLTALKTLIQAD